MERKALRQKGADAADQVEWRLDAPLGIPGLYRRVERGTRRPTSLLGVVHVDLVQVQFVEVCLDGVVERGLAAHLLLLARGDEPGPGVGLESYDGCRRRGSVDGGADRRRAGIAWHLEVGVLR